MHYDVEAGGESSKAKGDTCRSNTWLSFSIFATIMCLFALKFLPRTLGVSVRSTGCLYTTFLQDSMRLA
ncbi:hypothetical protein L210DRAFT_3548905 [Boletus edulis BED1]|uniref:Uncharacterized protein n=1 Tax=Boletus edulis BED1 TaxID=1328754 RepID=A0AAD4BPS8_BOLED|nr:hypothetical protein L210DRAFT_3548905 [Boletus edulis BED1]